jgi:hypothetical protein
LTSTVFVVVVVVVVVADSRGQFFFHNSSSFKNSIHGQISIDFDVVSLIILENFEFYEN